MVYLPVVRRRILTAPIEKPHFSQKHWHYFEAQVSESSRFYAARGALLMRFEVKRA